METTRELAEGISMIGIISILVGSIGSFIAGWKFRKEIAKAERRKIASLTARIEQLRTEKEEDQMIGAGHQH